MPFSKEEIASEERRPKKKVAVLIGYAGTGYKGLQINGAEKTIEGDIFQAFVAAGAISKANADDPKKSSLVRCARTDKGVHAAGNVLSLKLIVEDPDVVSKINEHLPPQIRVWGITKTTGSFSCYQTCDSRWYEYLIPTYSFLPPHPQSFLGKQLVESAEREGIYETYQSRQMDVANFWKTAEEEYVNPILVKLSPELRAEVVNTSHNQVKEEASEGDQEKVEADQVEQNASDLESKPVAAEDAAVDPELPKAAEPASDTIEKDAGTDIEMKDAPEEVAAAADPSSTPLLTLLEEAVKEVKAAYVAAKKAYRISEVRRKAVQDALELYVGTINFHNYTVSKSFKDPSAKRVIRSFKVGPEPIIINGTEWLSLKVHGQSFMMHQIRKMVAMVALTIRCGTGLERMRESYGPARLSIPKAPGLGLLLERPMFGSYNEKTAKEFSKEPLDFSQFEEKINEFKQKEIYERIFKVENEKHEFHTFFHHVDNYKTGAFLWLTATGIPAVKQYAEKTGNRNSVKAEVDSDDEREPGKEEG